MEVKVSNISRYATIDSIRNIFSPLGEILHIECYTSPDKRDGCQEADIIYANLTEAKLAIEMNKTQLGDRQFTVEPIMNRFRFNVAPELGSTRINLTSECAEQVVRTILIRGLSSELTRAQLEAFVEGLAGEKPLVALYGKNILRPAAEVAVDFDAAMAAVEFSSRALMLRTLLGLRSAPLEKLSEIVALGRTVLVDEAWKTVDPSIKRPEQLLLANKLATTSYNRTDREIDTRKTSPSRDYDRERRRTRDRSRSRDYRRRSRSRSPSTRHGRDYRRVSRSPDRRRR